MKEDILKEILNRGVENVFPNKEFAEKLLKSGKKLSFYLGIDPTGPSLHLGHAINLRKLAELQKLGHKVVLLIGDFTATIGDPTGKDATRKSLSVAEVARNFKNYKKQAVAFLNFSGKGAALIRYNSEWLSKMNLSEVMKLLSHMTVEQMLKRDMFEDRIKNARPIFIHEFLYPLFHGYDGVAMEVDGEIGGNDQTFNMLVGRQLLKQIKNKEKIIIAMKLLTDSSGRKMGKTEGNMITLSDSSNEMFGKVMSWTDEMIISGFELCTDLSMKQVKQMEKDLKRGVNPKELKVRLAKEIVKIYHGENAAEKATAAFSAAFQKREAPLEIEIVKIKKGQKLGDVLLRQGLVKSKTEFSRLVAEGAVSVIGSEEKIKDKDFKIETTTDFKIGKKRFLRVNVE